MKFKKKTDGGRRASPYFGIDEKREKEKNESVFPNATGKTFKSEWGKNKESRSCRGGPREGKKACTSVAKANGRGERETANEIPIRRRVTRCGGTSGKFFWIRVQSKERSASKREVRP